MTAIEPPQRDIFTVTRLNREVKLLLETRLGLIWIEGELSNFSRPASGHWYFSLKDERAQVRCAMFRGRNRLLRQPPQQGDRVLVRARLSLYEARGDYQLIVEHMEPAGQGDLQRRFDALKGKLENEGLFDSGRKKPLPAFPGRIGVISSASGAALRDILSVLSRRSPMIPVRVFPVAVQGRESAPAIIEAIDRANRRGECDVIILARGGGSLEDLWSFNEESVARAIAASDLPVVTGIGHETDFTISDFVADLRAPTPSVAAEQAGPDRDALLWRLAQLNQKMERLVRHQLSHQQRQLRHLDQRLKNQHPKRQLEQKQQRLDELVTRLRQSLERQLNNRERQLQNLQHRLTLQHPKRQLEDARQRLTRQSGALHNAMQQRLQASRQQLDLACRGLHAVSPLNTLNRGYAIALSEQSGRAIRSSDEVKTDDALSLRLSRGEISVRVVAKTAKRTQRG